MGDYRKLNVWRLAENAAVSVYNATAGMPPDERFGLTTQMRRAAVSVVANIAEGSGRGRDQDRVQFLRMARGSAHELTCELRLSVRLGYMQRAEVEQLLGEIDEVAAHLTNLIRATHER